MSEQMLVWMGKDLHEQAIADYRNLVDAALYHGRDVSHFDPEVVRHVRRWHAAEMTTNYELRQRSLKNVRDAIERVLRERHQ